MDPVEFQRTVDAILDDLPTWVVEKLDNLVVVVEESPPPELTGSLGVYEGVSLLERSGDYWGAIPDQITVFRGPHMEMGLDDLDLRSEIRRTVLHEIAHHIGIEDDRLEELGWD